MARQVSLEVSLEVSGGSSLATAASTSGTAVTLSLRFEPGRAIARETRLSRLVHRRNPTGQLSLSRRSSRS